jgi:hypothetical protein
MTATRAAQETDQRIHYLGRVHEGHEVVVVEFDDLALRHEPVMFPRCCDWDTSICDAVKNQHRTAIALQYSS